MCLFTSALRASVNKSHVPSLPQNNLYLFTETEGNSVFCGPETAVVSRGKTEVINYACRLSYIARIILCMMMNDEKQYLFRDVQSAIAGLSGALYYQGITNYHLFFTLLGFLCS